MHADLNAWGDEYAACHSLRRAHSGLGSPVTFCRHCPVTGDCLTQAVLRDERWGLAATIRDQVATATPRTPSELHTVTFEIVAHENATAVDVARQAAIRWNAVVDEAGCTGRVSAARFAAAVPHPHRDRTVIHIFDGVMRR